MTHPAIDEAAAARLRASLADATTGSTGRTEPSEAPPAPEAPPTLVASSVAKAKELARRAAAPAIARLRQEMATVAAQDTSDLHAEVAALRDELARTCAEHDAELAALHEEVAAARHPSRRTPAS